MFAAALLLLQTASGSTNPLATGSNLLAACASEELHLRGLCTAYILGIGDGADLQRAMADVYGNKPYCVYQMPAATTGSQMRAAVIDYIQQHPEKGSESGSKLVIAAFEKSFPCPAE
ncbi:hypothetical protein JQK15_18595 [Sphingobium sp. BHU LFT2]|uniref:Rap1a/Tai family immunity protein n=1 Tax=Sphingobium sp. BHU LFT2 TaxID=2807634 RepID=UPI001BEC05A6|nr:Rap1a/Tai family immunity protein [Sphingobium sp. BHU LFT2]MBT2245538.1 hypothetical protein [Sphingobium sp. BHU LFT2]